MSNYQLQSRFKNGDTVTEDLMPIINISRRMTKAMHKQKCFMNYDAKYKGTKKLEQKFSIRT